MAVKISGVEPHSPAQKANIEPGETLISINGHTIMDVLDYRFYETAPYVKLCLQSDNGSEREVSIRKPEYGSLGLDFETYLMDAQRACRNKCIFCFIDQLPKGLRESLYFKDDDSRLSFLFGNYITLTNVSEHEISRIIEMHISPVNISVHTTNPELRCKMMNNRFAGDALKALTRFAEAGIKLNCQMVLCPGINDGEELLRSLHDLAALAPAVQCVAAVPVGLTKFREGLYPLKPYTKETAQAVLDIVESFGEECLRKLGTRLVYPADEFYLKAEQPIPQAEFYEDFAQLENGVGLLSLMRQEIHDALEDFSCDGRKRHVTIVSGTAAQPFMDCLLDELRNQCHNLTCNVIAVKNEFFGESITVSGLVTGGDIIRQLQGVDLGDELLLPAVMLRREGNLFLDDTTPQQVGAALHIPVRIFANSGQAVIDAILGEE